MNKKLQMLKGIKSASMAPTLQTVRQRSLHHAHGAIPVLESHDASLDINQWAAEHHALVEELYSLHGAVLLRGFRVADDHAFYRFSTLFTDAMMDYTESSTPRTKVTDKVYTSTEYPRDEFIPMHNEHSYSNHWPQKIWFHCVTKAAQGGQTPLADSRKVLEAISENTRQRFEEKGVMYVRNFGEQVDLPWSEVFQTTDQREVEAYCDQHGIRYEWTQHGLRTTQVCQGIVPHPRTGELLWFNQAHLFHVSNLAEEVQAYLLDRHGEENLPRNTYYGDGTPLEDEVLTEIRNAFDQCLITFDWAAGDIIMLDNMLYAHGRFPFEGPRKVLVSMAEPYYRLVQPILAN